MIGAGHAGLAVSRLLTAAGRDHVVLERGRVAERWRTERWDSLHLLTPELDDPAARAGVRRAGSRTRFMPRRRLRRATSSVRARRSTRRCMTGTTVLGVAAHRRAALPRGHRPRYVARPHVVIATGPHGVPQVPAGLAPRTVLTADRYRNPAQLPSGGVLVVGASSSGVQIADELNRAGRDVVLAVGRHTRMPRTYRGHGHLLVAAAHRPPRPNDRHRSRRRSRLAASRHCSWSDAGR